MDTYVRHALAAGQTISCHAGRHTVTLQQIRDDVYRVEVRHGGPAAPLIDELSGSYESLTLARDLARTLVKALQRDGATIDTTRAAVADWLETQMAFLTAADTVQAATAAAYLQRIRARFESASERDWSAKLIDRINATLAARNVGPAGSFAEIRDRHAAAIERDAKARADR